MKWLNWSIENNIALLTLGYKDQNCFSGHFLTEVRQAMATLAEDESVKALIITGAHEKYFCNGLDVEWIQEQEQNVVDDFLIEISQLLKDTAIFPKPIIGAINGHAFGMGTIWSSGFDFRIMRDDRGWVCFPEMDINLPFLPGMIAICEHGLGKRLFREMAWSAKRYGGTEAVEIGWARQAVAKDKLLPAAMELANFMCQKKQPAFAVTKRRWAMEVVRVIDELDPVAIKG